MNHKSARRPLAFYLSMAAIALFAAATVIGFIEHGVDQKAGAAILGGLLFSVLAMGKRQP
jgi:hypothetical protein